MQEAFETIQWFSAYWITSAVGLRPGSVSNLQTPDERRAVGFAEWRALRGIGAAELGLDPIECRDARQCLRRPRCRFGPGHVLEPASHMALSAIRGSLWMANTGVRRSHLLSSHNLD